MTHGSIFSGIGGFDIAAEWAGFDNLFNCEIDTFCQNILAYYWPNAKQYADIKTTDFREWHRRVDVLTGGFPCQPFSLAGKRTGAGDDRYLWPQMLRVISEVRPTWVIGENVGGIVSMVEPGREVDVETQAALFGTDHQETEEYQQFVIERICRDIESIGYSVQPILIPACGVGAPHRRDRVWFLAENTECVRCNGGKPEEESQTGGLGEFSSGDNVRICGEAGTGHYCPPLYKFPNCGDCDCCDGIEMFRSSEHCKWITPNCSDTGFETMCESPICTDAIGFVTNSKSKRFQKRNEKQTWDGSYPTTQRHDSIPCWQDFPTQSPVCSRDDGFPERLDGITIPKWRTESIKGFGNAVVPQIPYLILKAIKEIEQQIKVK